MAKLLTRVEFTNLNKILYPERGITKAKIIEYYIRKAPMMLDLLTNRPIVLTRYPDGVDKPGFYEKDAPLGTPSWVETFKRYSETAKRDIDYVIVNELDTLVWLANLAALEMHMTLSLKDSFESPDLVLFDMDPEPPANFGTTVEVALLLKEKLDQLGLASHVKTSGKKGLHVVIPIVRDYTFRQTREFVHQIGRIMAKESENVASEFSKSKTPGAVYIDYLQNSHGKTMVCPYSLRATPQATVSTPLSWEDLRKGIKLDAFDMFNVAQIKEAPWKGLLMNRQKLEMT